MSEKGINAAGPGNWNKMVASTSSAPPKGRVPGLDQATLDAWGNGLRGMSDGQIDQTMDKTFTWYRNHANRYGFVDDKKSNTDPHDKFRQEVGELYGLYQKFKPDGIDSNEARTLCREAGSFSGGSDAALYKMLRHGNQLLDMGQAQLPD